MANNITEINQILNELRAIRIDIEFIRGSMPDREMFLTADEKKLLDESYENEKNGELVLSEDLRNELKI